MKKRILFILTFSLLLINSCSEDETITIETINTDLIVFSSENKLFWLDETDLNEQITTTISFYHSNVPQNEIEKLITINSDTTTVIATINFKEEFQDKYYDSNLNNNTVTVLLEKENPIPNDGNMNDFLSPSERISLHNSLTELASFNLGIQSVVEIPITFHKIPNINLSQNEIDEAISILNDNFFSSKILFYHCGTNIIEGDNSYYHHTQYDSTLANENDVPNTINIYVTKSITNQSGKSIDGYTHFPFEDEDRLFIKKIWLNNDILVHEMGHFFSLYHTFEDEPYNIYVPDGFSGCEWEGDGICDTPFTTQEDASSFTCFALTEDQRIINKNFMSYSVVLCQKEFTDDQIKRIAFSVRNHRSYLQCNDNNNYSEIEITGNLNFTETQINTNSQPLQFTVSNTGIQNFNITDIIMPEGFELLNGQNTVVTPTTPKNFEVRFTPTEAQTYKGIITIENNADNANSSNSSIQVTGIGVDNSGSSSISVSDNIVFGDRQINSSHVDTFTISNSGTENFFVSNISFPNGYELDWNSGTITPGNPRTVTVTFSPTQVQSYNGNIVVSHNADNGNNTISVSGNGVDNSGNSSISVSGNLNFNEIEIGNNSTRLFTIHNNGSLNFNVSSINFPYNVYSSNWNSGTINGNSSQDVTVIFEPTNEQTYNGTVSVNHNADNGNGSIAISGTGTNNNSGQPNIVFSNSEIEDDNNNNNNVIDAGEDIEYDIQIHNAGDATATDIIATISTNDSDINITDNDRSYGTMEQGEFKWNTGDFNFIVASDAPTKTVIFTIDFSSNEGNWSDTFSINIQGQNGSNPIPISPTDGCAASPIMQVNTEYVVNLNLATSGFQHFQPIEGQSANGDDVQGFYLSFQVPENWDANHDVKIYDISSNFDPVFGIKANCNAGYLGQRDGNGGFNDYVDGDGLGGNETSDTNLPEGNNGGTPDSIYHIRIYHYNGGVSPNISFKVIVE